MSALCGPVQTVRVFDSLVNLIGPKKKEGERVSLDDWKRIFDAIGDLK